MEPFEYRRVGGFDPEQVPVRAGPPPFRIGAPVALSEAQGYRKAGPGFYFRDDFSHGFPAEIQILARLQHDCLVADAPGPYRGVNEVFAAEPVPQQFAIVFPQPAVRTVFPAMIGELDEPPEMDGIAHCLCAQHVGRMKEALKVFAMGIEEWNEPLGSRIFSVQRRFQCIGEIHLLHPRHGIRCGMRARQFRMNDTTGPYLAGLQQLNLIFSPRDRPPGIPGRAAEKSCAGGNGSAKFRPFPAACQGAHLGYGEGLKATPPLAPRPGRMADIARGPGIYDVTSVPDLICYNGIVREGIHED